MIAAASWQPQPMQRRFIMRVHRFSSFCSALLRRLLAGSLGLLAGAGHATDAESPVRPQRHALVLGNADYLQLADLPSARADAARLRSELLALGFQVMAVDMLASAGSFYDEVLPAFREQLREGDLALVYFSGHGFSYGSDNFLAPLDLPKVLTRNELADRAVSLEAIQSALARRKPGALVLLVDACRAVGGFVVDAGASGLAPAAMSPMSQPVAPALNLYAGFAARPGKLAIGSSEPGKLSVFTNSLAPRLSNRAEFVAMFRDVVVDVHQLSGEDQDPGLVLFTETDLYLPSDADREQDEHLAWLVALSSGNRANVDGFRRRHALSPYAKAARRWLAEHPAEPVAVADISPLALEKSWHQPALRISTQAGLTLALPARLNLAAVQAPLAAGLPTAELPDETLGEGPSEQLARLLAYRQAVTATDITARASPSHGAAAIASVPAGTEVIVRDVQRRAENGSAWLEVQMASSGLRGYVPLSTGHAQPSKPVSVGSGLLEVVALPVPGRLPDLIDAQVVKGALARLAAEGKVIHRVSVATAAGADAETERLDRLARSNHASFLLRQGGIPADRITAVAEAPGMQGPGVRIRFFGQ
ncbi:MAG TPA: caspase family protein [Burkholderiaceae bacterium]|nr:caspase family protein [Burkholderiaceae bacterium]